MGSWGTKPNENDGAADLSDMTRHRGLSVLSKEYGRKRADSFIRFERAGAVYDLLKMGYLFQISKKYIRGAISDLEELLCDPEFVGTWRSPARYVKDTKAAIKYLRGKVRYGG